MGLSCHPEFQKSQAGTCWFRVVWLGLHTRYISFLGCHNKVRHQKCILSSGPRSQKSGCWQGRAPSGPFLPLASSGGHRRPLTGGNITPVCLHPHVAPSSSVCVFARHFPLLISALSYWIRVHPNDLISAWLHLPRPSIQIKPHSQVWGLGLQPILLGDIIQPITPVLELVI